MRVLVLVLLLVPARAYGLACIASSGITVATWCPRPPAFSRTVLSISHDDGASWTDAAPEVDDACVTDEGIVLALVRGPSLFRFGASVTSQPVPLTSAWAIRSLGAEVFVVGQRGAEPHLLRTIDDGAHWDDLATLDTISSLHDFDATPSAHGVRVRVLSSEGLSCFGTVRERVDVFEDEHVHGAMLLDEMACANEGSRCARLDVLGLGAHGAIFGVARDSNESEAGHVVRVAATERVTFTDLRTEGPMWVAHNGRITLALVGGRLVRLEDDHVVVLDRHAPTGVDGLYVDPRGRAWVMADGLLRFSRGRGFERITPW